MDLNTFLDHFDTIAEAPSGITQLKALILDLAVRGKLVPQNSEDEPAVLALEKVEEAPYFIPHNWIWLQLGQVINFVNGFAFKSSEFVNSGVGVIRIGDIIDGQVDASSMKYVTMEYLNKLDKKFRICPGDMLIAMSGATTGKIGFNRTQEIFLLNQRVGKIIPINIHSQYLYYFLNTQIKKNLEASFGSAIPNLSTQYINSIYVPLPPLAEQKRIVEKVDELMALCDRLAAAKQARDDLRQKLRGSAIAALMNAETDEALEKSWAIVRDNWHTLSQDPKDVDDLRKIILRLAIRGKLAQQEVNDEPAEKLLKVVADKQAAHPKKFRKPKDLSSIENLEKPFELPFGWCWCRFIEIGQLERGKSKHRPRNEPALYANGSIPLVQTGDVARAKGVITTYTALYNEQGLAQSRLWSKGTLCITINCSQYS